MRMTKVIVSAFLATLGLALAWLWWSAADLDRPVNFKEATLTARPNQFLACPAGYCADTPHMISPTFPVTRAELATAWDAMMDGKTRFRQLATHDESDRRQYEERSKLIGFPDRISVQFLPLSPDTSSVAVYSRSKYGYSDMGVNEARVGRLMAELKAKLDQHDNNTGASE